jgi:hypothetical protein
MPVFEVHHLCCFPEDLSVHLWYGMRPVKPFWDFSERAHVGSEYSVHYRDQQWMNVGVDSTHFEYTQDRVGIPQFVHRAGDHVRVIFNQLVVDSVLVRSDDDLYAANHRRCRFACRQVNGVQAVQIAQNRLQSVWVVVMQGDLRSARLLEILD